MKRNNKIGRIMKKGAIFILAIFVMAFFLFMAGRVDTYANTSYKHGHSNLFSNQPTSQIQTIQPGSSPNFLPLYMKAIGFIVVFIVIIYGYIKFNKKLMLDRNIKHDSANIQIIGAKMIGPKRSLYIVEVLDHVLLLGITDNQISVLLDIPIENLSPDLKQSWQSQNIESESLFKKITSQLLNR